MTAAVNRLLGELVTTVQLLVLNQQMLLSVRATPERPNDMAIAVGQLQGQLVELLAAARALERESVR